MRHFTSRDDLVDLVGECPRSTVRRLVLQGQVECLGRFTRISETDNRFAWLFRVWGDKKEWIVAALGATQFRILKKVPWKYWDGQPGSITGGDNPIFYAMRCNHAINADQQA